MRANAATISTPKRHASKAPLLQEDLGLANVSFLYWTPDILTSEGIPIVHDPPSRSPLGAATRQQSGSSWLLQTFRFSSRSCTPHVFCIGSRNTPSCPSLSLQQQLLFSLCSSIQRLHGGQHSVPCTLSSCRL